MYGDLAFALVGKAVVYIGFGVGHVSYHTAHIVVAPDGGRANGGAFIHLGARVHASGDAADIVLVSLDGAAERTVAHLGAHIHLTHDTTDILRFATTATTIQVAFTHMAVLYIAHARRVARVLREPSHDQPLVVVIACVKAGMGERDVTHTAVLDITK